MNERFIKSEPTNKDMIKKFKEEGMPIIGEIQEALNNNNQEFINIEPENENKASKKLHKQKDGEINFNQEIKFISNFTKKIENYINNYNQIKKDNNYFITAFHNMQKRHKENTSNQQKKYNYALGNLLTKYLNKGLVISKDSLDKDVYKESSLLIPKRRLNKFYKYDFIINEKTIDKRINKNINFLKKIKKQTNRKYELTLLKGAKLDENYIYANANIHERKKELQPKLVNSKSEDLYRYFNKITYSLKDIQNEKREIRKIKKLILEEEKRLFQQRNQNKKNANNNYNSNNNITNKNKTEDNSLFLNRLNKGKRTRSINPIMSTSIMENKNKKLISEINHLNNLNSLNSESTNLSIGNKNHDKEKKDIKLFHIYNQLSLLNYIKKRQSSIYFMNKNNPLNYSNSLNIHKKRKSSLDIPKNLNRALTVNEAYDKITDLGFISHQKNSEIKREKVKTLLKKYYGKKYQEFNEKNNHIHILNNCEKIKEKIIETEKTSTFVKYKNELPRLLQNKIELNLRLNKKLKNYGKDFIISFYDKKLND